MTAEELNNKMMRISRDYFLVDIRKDRDSYYALTPEDLRKYRFCCAGLCLNYIMDGELKKAWEVIENISEDKLMKLGLILVHPEVSWEKFIGIINFLKKNNTPIRSVMFTASRPYLLNGFNDFSRLGPLLEGHKAQFMEGLKFIYDGECVPFIYNLCLAEYFYQQNKLMEAEILVSSSLKEFDRDNERRFLFAALYLQSKILFAQGNYINGDSYIKNVRKMVRRDGNAECAYNIDAAEIVFALYEGNYSLIYSWMATKAPDEFADFNMLDLYRYMVKMRCYIIIKNYAAVIALAERLRPFLKAGRRHMDLCEIDILSAMSLYCAGRKDLAFAAFERAFKIARRRRYYRLIADEGDIILHLMIDYMNQNGKNDCLLHLIEMARPIAISYPLYLKVQYQNNQEFSPMEIDILKLLEHGKSKEEIGEYFFISINTVKYHMKKIYAKLNAKSAHHAVWQAKLLHII